MKVYRIEKNGYGPFCDMSGLKTTYPSDAMYSIYGCTCQQVTKWDSDFRFGCRTIDKLIEYFGSDFAKLINQGGKIVEYEVNMKYVYFGYRGMELAFRVNMIKYRKEIT